MMKRIQNIKTLSNKDLAGSPTQEPIIPQLSYLVPCFHFTMPPVSTLASDAIAVILGALFAVVGQAQFTPRFLPGAATWSKQVTTNIYRAVPFLSLSLPTVRLVPFWQGCTDMIQLRSVLGGIELVVGVLLILPKTRRLGFALAVLAFSAGIYAQLCNGADPGQMGSLWALGFAGYALAPERRGRA